MNQMAKLENLSKFGKLSKEDQKRLLKVHSIREDNNYNLTGNSSISEKELKKAKKL